MRFIIYRDKKKEWRWHIKAKNGKIIAHGESYKRRSSVYNVLELFKTIYLGIEIVEES